MADSAAKRRKTSPTTSIPIDAPTTPSRIPAPRKDGPQSTSRTHSFASPTKASLSRHNPQLLNRPTSSGGLGRREKDLEDVFARALAEKMFTAPPDSQATGYEKDGLRSGSTTQENDPSAYDTFAKTPPRASSRGPIGGGLSAKPRRLSRSPVKALERSPVNFPAAETLPNDFNPFKKKGLRRSPISSSAGASAPMPQDAAAVDSVNPFKKTGLRRSPVSSQPLNSQPDGGVRSSPVISQPEARIRRSPPTLSQPLETAFRVSPTAPEISSAALETIPEPFSPSKKLRRSPIFSEPVAHVVEKLPEPFSPIKRLRRSPVVSETISTALDKRPEPFSPTKSLRRSPVITQATKSAPRRSSPRLAALENIEPGKRTSPEQPEANAVQSMQVDPFPGPRRTVAEIPRDSGLSQPQNPAPESRQQPTVIPTDPVVQPKSVFAEVTEEPERGMEVPAIAENLNLSRTPAGRLSRRSFGLKVPTESQQDSPSDIAESGQRQGPSKMDEAVHDLVTGNRRAQEPELPPTPSQLGIADPVVTTPPTGIHDTPSKRARRNKALGAKIKSSPLKPRDPPPQEPPKSILQPELKPDQPKRRKSARFLIPEDPHASKKKEREDLLKQLQQLQADVALANQENERLRICSESRKKGLSAAPNPEEVQSMLLRSVAPEASTKHAPKPPSIFQSMRFFLPFAGRRRRAAVMEPEKPLPSHLPIALSDPLPYLQAFSPLNYSSTITVLPTEHLSDDTSLLPDEKSVLQRHVITASHPSGLFSARLSMTVDTASYTISALDILRLDMNAEKELGTFIRARSRTDHPLGKDITVVCWAMLRWIEVSIQRAQFWCTIEKECGTPQARATILQKKRKWKRQGSVLNVEASAPNEVDESVEKQIWTRRQLCPHIGRTSLELSDENVELRFEWKLSFDWAGEVETVMSASARLPQSWQKLDDRNSLAKIPETFSKMVKERGPLAAVRATVELFMPVS
ncbi:uncharacterized protein RSE6_02956 [Rhynchosporium secalis]|uniref:Uncharacterized protein n=1 Tax=Rhynchosporium secalis TaxID=38038 RepID=A0A1E1M1K2_RHYSE|nr:uncharacterized protein RSE6_02956 [Rhynchosporium secalis]